MPVLVLDESTYIGGYTYLVDDMNVYFKNRKMNVLYLPGLWLLHHCPEDLCNQVFHIARNTSGYWIFPLASLWQSPGSLKGDSRIAGSQAQYWLTLAEGNSELDEYLKSNGKYESYLVPPSYNIGPYDFIVGDSGEYLKITNTGSDHLAGHSFADRYEVRVFVNGELTAHIPAIKAMGESDWIRFTPEFGETGTVYEEMGLIKIAVTDSSGRLYNLLGETDTSVSR